MTGRWCTVTGAHSIPAMPSTKGWNKKGFARACPAQAVWTMPLWRAYGAYSKTEMYYLHHFKGYHELCEAVAAYINFYNRPLAKLSKAVKVADTGNQGKAESKALSAVTVTL